MMSHLPNCSMINHLMGTLETGSQNITVNFWYAYANCPGFFLQEVKL